MPAYAPFSPRTLCSPRRACAWLLKLAIAVTLLGGYDATALEVAGPIGTDSEWTLADSPVVLTGTTSVLDGVTLTIAPGVSVLAAASAALLINGTLVARGTEELPIILGPTGTSWGYLQFGPTSVDATFDVNQAYVSGCIMEWCEIRRSGGLAVTPNAMVRLRDAQPYFANVKFIEGTATALQFFDGANPQIRLDNCEFLDINTNASTSQPVVFFVDDTGGINQAQGLVAFYQGKVSNSSGAGYIRGEANFFIRDFELAGNDATNKYGISGLDVSVFDSSFQSNINNLGLVASENSSSASQDIIIETCRFSDNERVLFYLYAINNDTTQIINSEFSYNSSSTHLMDEDVQTSFGNSRTLTMRENIFLGNEAGLSFFQTNVYNGELKTFSGNIFVDNQAVRMLDIQPSIEQAWLNNVFFRNSFAEAGMLNADYTGFIVRGNSAIQNQGNVAAIRIKAVEPNRSFADRHQILENLFFENQSTALISGDLIQVVGSSSSTGSTYDEILRNNFIGNSATFNLAYRVSSTYQPLSAINNYWETTNTSQISQSIYDVFDDATRSEVSFFPILSAPSPDAPLSPVQNVAVVQGAPGSYTVSWDANPEPDTAGYFVYVWDGAQTEPYFYVLDEASVIADAGNTTGKQVSGLGGGLHYFSVTAYDGDYDGNAEDPDTPVIENMTAGNESFFSDPVPASGEVNQPPLLDAIGNQTVSYETLLEFTVTASDPNVGDVLTLSAEGVPGTASFDPDTGVFSWTPSLEEEGAYDVTFTVTDLFGGETDAETITITVLGPDVTGPVITLTGGNNINVPCGEPFVDPGATAEDDREGDVSGSIVVSGDTVDTSAPNVYVLDYDAEDSLGNVAVTVSRIVNVVDSTPPVVTVLGANPLTIPVFGTFSEPGFSASDACEGDLTGSVVVDGLDDLDTAVPGLYTLTYRATDSGNNTGQATRTVAVVNSPPVLAEIGDKTITTGNALGFTVSASDPNDGDTLVISTSALPGTATFDDGGAGSGEFSWTPGLPDVGGYEVTFTTTDAAGAQDSETITITVEPDSTNAVFGTVRESGSGNPLPGVQVSLDEQAGPYTAATQTDANGNYLLEGPAGGGASDVTFTLATYQTRTVSGVLAPRRLDVNLTSTIPATPSGLEGRAAVGGNLLRWDPNTETDLAGYNLYVSEAGGAFDKVNDTPIEEIEFVHGGLTPGTIYTYEITAIDTDDNESPRAASIDVEAGKIEIFVPRVSAAAGTEVRIPINVNNAAGINPQGMDIDFRYPAALLGGDGVNGVRLERTALTREVVPLSNPGEAGRVRISSIGEAQTLVGEGHIFNIYLTLGEDTAGLCEPMELANVKFFDDSVPPQALVVDFSTAGDLCGDVACMQGDLNGDFEVNSADVLVALQVSVGLLELTSCQLQAGDLNGDQIINSADGIMIQRLAVGLPLNPPQAGAKQAPERRAPKGSTLQVSVDAVSGAPGSLVQVPVRVANAAGLTGLDLTLAFPGDPSQLTLESVSNGPLLSGFSRIQNIGSGFVKLGFSSALPATQDGGVAALLNFRIAAAAPDASAFPVTLNDARVNGQFGDNFAWTQVIARANGSVTVGEGQSSAPAAALLQFGTLDTSGNHALSPEEAALGGIDDTLFAALDTNGNGALEVHELIEAAGTDASVHRADQNADGAFSLAELLRLIQLYNAGAYQCDTQGEDGYRIANEKDLKALDPGCLAHSADYLAGGSGAIELSELLRQIQIYNLGGYTHCKGQTEDNFCPNS
ncbi:MAG: DUF5011 domain-containing protein [Candidatus Hydrogenedens sp.]|nr:DUF5011 domain-containing protein [Candidatus Hydrogenedens sp.]